MKAKQTRNKLVLTWEKGDEIVPGETINIYFEHKDNFEWVEINNENCPTLEKYGCKPFKIMKKKMRNKDGKVWNNINFYEAKEEAEKLGYRLPDIREMLALLEHYKLVNQNISHKDKDFLGIEELSYGEDVCFEWIEGAGCAFLRRTSWVYTSYAGDFILDLDAAPTNRHHNVGFRCTSDLP